MAILLWENEINEALYRGKGIRVVFYNILSYGFSRTILDCLYYNASLVIGRVMIQKIKQAFKIDSFQSRRVRDATRV